MQTLLQDIRYALRQLRHAPGFAATAILTLALGIGATTSIFTLVYQVVLRSIPVSHPEQLYKVGKEIECCVDGGLQDHWRIFSYDLYKYLRDQTPGTEGVIAVDAASTTVSARRPDDPGAAQPLQIRFISGNYFSVLEVQPFAGRLLRPEDDRAGAAPAAVISYTLWQSKFAGDPHLLGSTLMLTGHPVTIVGITASNFHGERNQPDAPGLWVALAMEPVFQPERKLLNFPADHWLDVLIRVKNPGDVAKVQLAVQGELKQWILSNREYFPTSTQDDLMKQTTELASASTGINDLRDRFEKSLHLLLWVAGFVLLIACANLANLMLVRGMARQQELAVRSALGAPQARLIRQMLVEALLLSLFGGAAALLVAYAGTRAILALAITNAEVSPLAATPSLPVLAFALVVSVFTGVLFGIAPAWIASRSNPVEALRGANRSSGDASALPQKLLVILQAALSLALLSTAGLLITSLRQLEHQNFHFHPEGRLLLFIDLQAAGIKVDRIPALYQRFDDTFAHLPGVQSFAYASYTPMSYNNWAGGIFLPGQNPVGKQTGASYDAISPDYFQTVGTQLLRGRGFSEHDTATSTHVAVINQTFADHYLKGKQPIGEHFGPAPSMTTEYEIVGVVADTKYGNPTEPARSMYFTPMAQTTHFLKEEDMTGEAFKHYASNLVVHFQGDQSAIANAVRQNLKSIDPAIPIMRMSSYTDQLADNFTQEELVVRLTTLFGLLALLLAAIGLYGVTAYAVARRKSEIGIRMALGASRGSVLKMVIRNALIQVGIGLAIGLPLTFAAGRFVQHTLYQTSAFQPLVLLSVVAMLLMATLAAAILPARRAASIEPMQALRSN